MMGTQLVHCIIRQSSPEEDASTVEDQANRAASPWTIERVSKPEVNERGREDTVSM
jgi:hypothetical protein